jgi:hypothetical protein
MIETLHFRALKLPVTVFACGLLTVSLLFLFTPQAAAASIGQCDRRANDVETCKRDFRVCETRYDARAEIDGCEKRVIQKYDSGGYKCGTGDNAIRTKFNLGCSGRVDSPIKDLAYALISFLSAGVGVVIVIAIIVAGIRYSTSEGNPEATMQAKRSIQNALIGLVIYIFAFAIINYLVPGGLLF